MEESSRHPLAFASRSLGDDIGPMGSAFPGIVYRWVSFLLLRFAFKSLCRTDSNGHVDGMLMAYTYTVHD